MCLTIFSCFSCCYSAESLYNKGKLSFREGILILQGNEKERNIVQIERAFDLVADGMYYFKLALSKDPGAEDALHFSYSKKAFKTISSFCASSTCSGALRRYLINHRVFNQAEIGTYEIAYRKNQFSWGDWGEDGIYMSGPDREKYNKEFKARSKKATEERIEKEKKQKEADLRYYEYKREKEREENQRREERDKYEKDHPEAKYLREAAESAAEQTALTRKQNALLKANNQIQEQQAEQATEQTRLLRKVADDSATIKYAADRINQGW